MSQKKNLKERKEAGITLIALVVTIVVLLILAGITIQLVFADGGIFSQANKAKEQTEIAVLREKIDNVRISYITDKMIGPSLKIDNLWDRLIGDIIASKEDVEGPVVEGTNNIYTLNTKDGYTVEIIVNETGLPEIGDIVKGALPPVIRKIEVSSTENGIKAKAIVSRLKNGTVEFWYKLSTENDSEYKSMTFISNEEGASINITLQEGAIYKVKVTAKNDAGEHTDYSEITIGLKVKEITLDKTEAIIKANDTVQLNLTITPEEAENKEVTWSSSNESVATVDENGLVTAVANGSAVITVATTDGSNLQATCNITVKIPVESVTLNTTSTQIKPNETITLIATINPENATNKNVTWSITSGSDYVSINSTTGVVTGVAEGTAIITVTSADDTTKKASCTVQVSNEDNWEEIAKWAEYIATTDGAVSGDGANKTAKRFANDTNPLKVGQTFKVYYGGKPVDVEIIDFLHDDLADGVSYASNPSKTKAGITFDFKNCIGEGQMNTTDTNEGGWKSSNMRKKEATPTEANYLTIPDIRNNLSENLKNVIKRVKKGTYRYEAQGTLDETYDDLWLLSEWEVLGERVQSIGQEGEQYAYYKTAANRKKTYNGSGRGWWLRSPNRPSASRFCYVENGNTSSCNPATNSRGVSLGFSI